MVPVQPGALRACAACSTTGGTLAPLLPPPPAAAGARHASSSRPGAASSSRPHRRRSVAAAAGRRGNVFLGESTEPKKGRGGSSDDEVPASVSAAAFRRGCGCLQRCVLCPALLVLHSTSLDPCTAACHAAPPRALLPRRRSCSTAAALITTRTKMRTASGRMKASRVGGWDVGARKSKHGVCWRAASRPSKPSVPRISRPANLLLTLISPCCSGRAAGGGAASAAAAAAGRRCGSSSGRPAAGRWGGG